MKTLFLGVIALCFSMGIVLSLLKISRSSQRRIYWGCACLATVSGFLLGYPNMTNAWALAGLALATMTCIAYAATPYLKIGGKIYALAISDRKPDAEDPAPSDPFPDSYNGTLTPATAWWLLVVIAVIAAGNVCAFVLGRGGLAVAAMGAVFLALLAVAAGYGDASWRYRVARGQYVPFVVASVITAGSFALVYLTAYYAARRWPLPGHPVHGIPSPSPAPAGPGEAEEK